MYLYSGEDNYTSYHSAYEKAKELAEKEQAEIVVLNGDELFDISELEKYTSNLSLFNQPAVVFIKRLLANSGLLSQITERLSEFEESNIVIWHDKKPDQRLKLVKNLKKRNRLFIFEKHKDRQIMNWLDSESRNRGVLLKPNQIERMVVDSDGDKWALSNELDKMVLFLEDKETKAISDDELKAILGIEARGDIWVFLDSLSNGKVKDSVSEMHKLLRSGENEQYLISMISRELGLLIRYLKLQPSGKTAQDLKIHPFVWQKTGSKARRFTLGKVKKLQLALLRLDIAIKQGKIDPLTGLTMYLLSWR